jgi:hypothetical protein
VVVRPLSVPQMTAADFAAALKSHGFRVAQSHTNAKRGNCGSAQRILSFEMPFSGIIGYLVPAGQIVLAVALAAVITVASKTWLSSCRAGAA